MSYVPDIVPVCWRRSSCLLPCLHLRLTRCALSLLLPVHAGLRCRSAIVDQLRSLALAKHVAS